MKYLLPVLLVCAIVVLGFFDPGDPRRDPVPAGQIVAHSVHCAGCHGEDPSGASLVDESGADVNIYDDWQVSMMGFSARDPFWRATINHETAAYPSAKSAIETTCLKCHAPLGTQQHQYDGVPYSYAALLSDSLGIDGVSCSACHLQTPESYGKGHSGNITVNTDRILYGPYDNPFEGPMELYVGFTPVFTDLISSSGVCAGCHTLITPTLDEDGTPTGNSFIEQATYHEWLNSSYPLQGKECQTCHMPALEDSIIIATGLKGLEKRSPFGLHQFRGANTAMLGMISKHRKALGIPDTIPESAWEESIQNNRQSLLNASDLSITSYGVFSDTLFIDVEIRNNTGHKLPSGYPSRVAWLQLVLTDVFTGDTIYRNGMLDAEGNIEGRDLPYEPHHQVSFSSEDVQIYELAMSDVHGALTTRLNAAYQPFKDNRLLPAGFRRSHPVYDTVAIWGNALGDKDYDQFSMLGRDNLQYRVPLNGFDGLADLQVVLRYHTFPSRWMQDLFTSTGIPEVDVFKSYYEDGYANVTEALDSFVIEGLNLEISSVGNINTSDIVVYPNPVTDGRINIMFPGTATSFDGWKYLLSDIRGSVFSSGDLSPSIDIGGHIANAVYLLSVTDPDGNHRIIKLIVH